MSNLKKVVALALALALVLTMFAGASIKSKLPVVDADQFTQAQLDAAALLKPLGVLAGMGADELGAGTVTRAQMVAFIYRLINGGDNGVNAYYSKTSVYSDVDPEAWYAPYLNWAYAAKVAYGYGATFGPNDPVTGAQAAAMLVRLLGKDASGNDYALKAQANAIALGLDKGIETKGLYESALARGDMFILLANALMTEYSDGKEITTIAEKYFDLEILNGAVLLGVDSLGSNNYNVFAFRVSGNDPKYFIAPYLTIEETGEDTTAGFDDIGCKYTLLVSKSKINTGFSSPNNEGYRQLYAAYEEPQNNYYKVVTGTIDDGTLSTAADGTLIYRANGKAVPLDKFVRFFYNGVETDLAGFTASLVPTNPAIWKLIDIDGDGDFDFVLAQRLVLADLKTETITAKVTAIAANGTLTLTLADGTTKQVSYGSYWNFSGGKWSIVDNTGKIKEALGIDQAGYAPYTGVSDVFYDFVVGGKYVYDIKVSEKTYFAGDYGVLAAWSTPLTMYKNMPYACFVNEKNEYFWAYVNTIDAAPAAVMAALTPANSLVYFTDGDYTDDVVSIYTADFWNSNYTYEELLTSAQVELQKNPKFDTSVTIDLKQRVYKPLYIHDEDGNLIDNSILDGIANEIGTTAPANFVYIVYPYDPADPNGDGDTSDAVYYKDKTTLQWTAVPAGTLVNKSTQDLVDGTYPALWDFLVEDMYVVPVTDSDMFYGLLGSDEVRLYEEAYFLYLGSVVVDVELGLKPTAGGLKGEQKQIYRANGFWHLRFWQSYDVLDPSDLTGKYYIALDDETKIEIFLDEDSGFWFFMPDQDWIDPGLAATLADFDRVALFIHGFDDAAFTTALDAAVTKMIADVPASAATAAQRSDFRLLDSSLGVVFAFGSVVDVDNRNSTMFRWVAYDAKTFNAANFGTGAFNADVMDAFGMYIRDELIFTKIGNKYYIKALKVTDPAATNLPYGWITANGYELVVYGGKTGAVDLEKGWEARILYLNENGIQDEKVWTKLYDGFAVTGDIMLVKVSEDRTTLLEVYKVGLVDIVDYLQYYDASYRDAGVLGWLTDKSTIAGLDTKGDYFRLSIGGKKIYYMWTSGTTLNWTDDFSKAPAKAGQYPKVAVYSCGGMSFVYYQGDPIIFSSNVKKAL